jgi:hypothetical protein
MWSIASHCAVISPSVMDVVARVSQKIRSSNFSTEASYERQKIISLLKILNRAQRHYFLCLSDDLFAASALPPSLRQPVSLSLTPGCRLLWPRATNSSIRTRVMTVDNYDWAADKHEDVWKPHLKILQDLGVNTLRLYSVDPSKKHDKGMCACSDAEIYVLVGMAAP